MRTRKLSIFVVLLESEQWEDIMTKELLLGNEAVARGAYEAGVRVAAAYPGTPSTEILENLARYDTVYSEWSPNEKVALDVAIGAAYAGSRAMAVMKHVGLNVAADAFFYVSMTGHDPNMHSSQNEQDNRHFAKFARLPCLEPSDSQEAKDLVGVALDMSEQFDGPVMLRLTTRISHSDTLVELGERSVKEPFKLPEYRIDRQAAQGVRRDLPLQPDRDGRLLTGHRCQWSSLSVC
jgi:indolepyruvate ferredoxin oxidoreductase alpha subunit